MTPPELGGPAEGELGGADPYVDPATGVLRNRLGLTDPDRLEDAEADFSAVRLAGLGRRPLPGNYDLAHLQRFQGFRVHLTQKQRQNSRSDHAAG